MDLPRLFLIFTLYSFIGWVCEVIYCSIPAKHFINRGFLHGPVCPVYGFGAMLVIFTLEPAKDNLLLLFVSAVVVTSLLEYVTSWALEAIFSTKWWDYSDHRFNINGRVSLVNSLLFGLMAVIAVLFVNPILISMVEALHYSAARLLALTVAVNFIIDIALTLKNLVAFDQYLARLHAFGDELKERFSGEEWFNAKDLPESIERLRQKITEGSAGISKHIRERLDAVIADGRENSRLLKAFPGMTSSTRSSQIELLKYHLLNELTARRQEKKIKKERKSKEIEAAFADAPAKTEENPAVFAEGLGGYKLFWVFFIGCIVGTVVETIWCVLTTGEFQNRAGVIYGPFNPVYGGGAVLMTVCLRKLAVKRDLWIFLGSMFIGGVFEYLCSLGQELIFGTVSWEYSGTQLNLDGRTNIMFAFCWGILGLLWVKDLYPYMSQLIERIPPKIGKPLTWFLVAFMVLNMGISALAVGRQTERREGVPADNAVRRFLDDHYTDEFLGVIYPNMQVRE